MQPDIERGETISMQPLKFTRSPKQLNCSNDFRHPFD